MGNFSRTSLSEKEELIWSLDSMYKGASVGDNRWCLHEPVTFVASNGEEYTFGALEVNFLGITDYQNFSNVYYYETNDERDENEDEYEGALDVAELPMDALKALHAAFEKQYNS